MAFETISLGSQPAGTGGDTARTAFEKVNRNFLAADVLAAAMSQAQFEANRNANKELYAASGWVSFGNHESGKQVNECKPGLYTALTTPNTLLIGKAGGVGGSKTDYASVHIDGVIFNLTNQFVLTLPSHPTSALPERMDMYGVESEKVEISAASPNAYQGGLRGVGAAVNLFSATDQQKKDFFAQNSNTTYIGSDGKIYQWQLYKVAFAGTTNGVPSPSEQGYSLNSFGDLWLKAGKNLLYFGNVMRLNDGGYHPSFNPLGAAKFVGDTFWYNTATSITSKADCFNPAKLLAGSGSITSGKSGRPEIGGRYYDAVYADGFGGVCRDMRWYALEISLDYFADVDMQVKSGKYRGFKKRVFTEVIQTEVSYVDSAIGGVFFKFTGYQPYELFTKDSAVFFPRTGRIAYPTRVEGYYGGATYLGNTKVISDSIFINESLVTYDPALGAAIAGDAAYVIKTSELNSYVGGKFLQTDIFANPISIINTPAISSGWSGCWGGLPIVGTDVKQPITRKCLSDTAFLTYTTNLGISWGVSVAEEIIASENAVKHASVSSDYVLAEQYQSFANQTKPANNAVVYGGNLGLSCVFASAFYDKSAGCILSESLFGRILKSTAHASFINIPLLSFSFNVDVLHPYSPFYTPKHSAITLVSPTNNSPSFKALTYNVAINQNASIHYAATELKYTNSNWGDDGNITIVDGESFKTDTNGQVVKVVTHELVEKIGWIKNKV